MKKILIILIAISLSVTKVEARTGIVVAHYGSSNDETRALTIDKITREIAENIPASTPVKEAYISPVVRKNLLKKGTKKLSPEEAFLAMRLEGVDTLIVQPSLIIDGGEMDEVRKAVEKVQPFFSHIEIGRPLCYSPSDFEKVVDILAKEDSKNVDAIVFVGHGNNLPSTSTYTQLDYMLADRNLKNMHVSTIEGYPTVETTIRQLQQSPNKIKKVKIVPFLLVCGNHTLHDIAGEFSETLKKNGYIPEVVFKGLGENAEIRNLYVERVMEMLIK